MWFVFGITQNWVMTLFIIFRYFFIKIIIVIIYWFLTWLMFAFKYISKLSLHDFKLSFHYKYINVKQKSHSFKSLNVSWHYINNFILFMYRFLLTFLVLIIKKTKSWDVFTEHFALCTLFKSLWIEIINFWTCFCIISTFLAQMNTQFRGTY